MNRKTLLLSVVLMIFSSLVVLSNNNDKCYQGKKTQISCEMFDEVSGAKEAMALRIEDGFIAAVLDSAGEYSFGGDPSGTSDYEDLTFSFPGTWSDWIKFKIDDSPAENTDEGFPLADSLFEEDETLFAIWSNYSGLKIIEKISIDEIYLDGEIFHLAKMEISVINVDTISHNFGTILFFDTNYGLHDDPDFETEYGYSDISEIFYAPVIPLLWKAYPRSYTPSDSSIIGAGFLYEFEAVMPDVFWHGQWSVSYGNGWPDSEWASDVTTDGSDSAIMMKWYQRTIIPSDTMTYITYFGLSTSEPMDIAMSMLVPEIIAGCEDEDAFPFELIFHLENTLDHDIADIELELSYLTDCMYLFDDSATHIIDFIESGETITESWTSSYDHCCRGRFIEGILLASTDTLTEELPFGFRIPEASDLTVELSVESPVIAIGDTAIFDIDYLGGERPIEITIEPEEYIIFNAFGYIKAIPDESTIFEIVVMDSLGCSFEFSVPITVVEGDLYAYAGEDQMVCFGEYVELGGMPTALCGEGPYTYHWTPEEGLDDPSSPNPTVTPMSSITYDLEVIDATGDTAYSEITLIVSPEIIADAGRDTSVLSGDIITLGGIPTGSGGYGELFYLWTPEIGLDDPSLPNPIATINGEITYQVHITDENLCEISDEITITIDARIREDISKPKNSSLIQNTPNPFNPITRIDYSLTKAGIIRLDVFDIMGNNIAILLEGYHASGEYSTIFDASDLPGGIYFYKLSGDDFDIMKKMVFVK